MCLINFPYFLFHILKIIKIVVYFGDNEKKLNIKISNKNNVSTVKFLEKVRFYEKIIGKTQLNAEYYKTNDIINASDFNICIQNLEAIYEELSKIKLNISENKTISDNVINSLQKINDDLSVVFKTFGTKKMFDLLTICYGTNYVKNLQSNTDDIFLDI